MSYSSLSAWHIKIDENMRNEWMSKWGDEETSIPWLTSNRPPGSSLMHYDRGLAASYFGFSSLGILKNLNGFLNLCSPTASAGIHCSAFPITSSHLPTHLKAGESSVPPFCLRIRPPTGMVTEMPSKASTQVFWDRDLEWVNKHQHISQA